MHSQGKYLLFISIGLLLAITGCAGDAGKASVTGKVTYKNAPVIGLTIKFEGANGAVSSAALDAEGNYKMTDAPVGNVQVSFVAPPAKMGGNVAIPKDVKPIEETGAVLKPTAIPQSYFTKDSAKLNQDVKKGKNTIDIELK